MQYSLKYTNGAYYLYRGETEIGIPSYAEKEFWMRIHDLEECLSYIYDHTSCTTRQIELINEVLPQEWYE